MTGYLALTTAARIEYHDADDVQYRDEGVMLVSTGDGVSESTDMVAFIPYQNLVALEPHDSDIEPKLPRSRSSERFETVR